MSDDVVAQAKAALEGVTEGPWSAGDGGYFDIASKSGTTEARYVLEFYPSPRSEDAEFCAAARSLVPELVAEVEKLRAWVAVVVEQQDRGVCPVCRYLFSECECRVLP